MPPESLVLLGSAFGADGLLDLSIAPNTNHMYQFDSCSDLLNWTTLTNCAGLGPGGALEICDPTAGQTQRYYRLK